MAKYEHRMDFMYMVIDICDHDFANTIEPLLRSIGKAVKWHGFYTEEELRRFFLNGVDFFYDMYQYSPKNGPTTEMREHAIEYIREARIIFGEEAEQFANTQDQDGASWMLTMVKNTVICNGVEVVVSNGKSVAPSYDYTIDRF